MIKQDIINNKFNNIKNFLCGSCNEGKSIGSIENYNEKHSESQLSEAYITGDSIESCQFTAISSCNICGENTVMSGIKYKIRNVVTYSDGINEIENEYEYRINYIKPSPFLIQIPQILKKVNEGILYKILLQSFILFWIDESSCANKIRIFIEELLDYLNHAGASSSKTLHKKIMDYKKIDGRNSERLLAIKWIGNKGSHMIEDINKANLIEVYEILELVLEKIFENKEIKIDKNVGRINLENQLIERKND